MATNSVGVRARGNDITAKGLILYYLLRLQFEGTASETHNGGALTQVICRVGKPESCLASIHLGGYAVSQELVFFLSYNSLGPGRSVSISRFEFKGRTWCRRFCKICAMPCG